MSEPHSRSTSDAYLSRETEKYLREMNVREECENDGEVSHGSLLLYSPGPPLRSPYSQLPLPFMASQTTSPGCSTGRPPGVVRPLEGP